MKVSDAKRKQQHRPTIVDGSCAASLAKMIPAAHGHLKDVRLLQPGGFPMEGGCPTLRQSVSSRVTYYDEIAAAAESNKNSSLENLDKMKKFSEKCRGVEISI